MSLRLLLLLICSVLTSSLAAQVPPTDANSFIQILVEKGRPRGPLGYFNSIYMAFTEEEARNLPNLVSMHSYIARTKNKGYWSGSPSGVAVRGMGDASFSTKSKRSSSYPDTVITGACENATGSLDRLCSFCPATTDLGPGKVPRYINEVMCVPGVENCGDALIQGTCQDSIILQDFLKVGILSLEVYTQAIRTCCECSLFP